MSFRKLIFKPFFDFICLIGKPFGGFRPRLIYDLLGRLAIEYPEFSWYHSSWGARLYLSPYYHIDRNIIIFGTYDEKLHTILERIIKPGMVCFDIGANIGEMTLHIASKLNRKGKVYSFEPIPSIHKRLQQHIQCNGFETIVQTYQLALSNTNGAVLMSCPDSLQDNQGLGSIVNVRSYASVISVRSMTLDEFVIRENVKKIDLIKIDIQGAEGLVLEGGPNVFMTMSPDILIEISPKDLKFASKTSRDLLLQIEKYGYQIFELRDGNFGSRIIPSKVKPTFQAENVFCTKHKDE